MSTQNKHTPMITLSKGGSGERTEKLETLQIPDCYCLAQTIRRSDPVAGKMLNDCWHIAHDLKRHALEIEESKAQLLTEFDPEMLMTIANELDSFKDSACAHSLRVIAVRQRAALSQAKGEPVE